MDLTILAYPFLFAAIYFEAFLLVTFLSRPARAARAREISTRTPVVAMVVPCYNEENTVGGTIDSLIKLEYPPDQLRIILVNDGSTDNTGAVMDAYRTHPQVTVIHKENGGKDTALNAGIAAAPEAELVGCLDADSFVEANALKEMISSFDDPKVGASTAAMSVHNAKSILERMQNAEYILGIALRHILASINGLYVTPGPFSLYRRDALVSLGGFRSGHNTEDMEMALRMQRAGLIIENAPGARVFTKAPKTVPALLKQRVRWTTGFLRNMLYDYRDLVGNPKYGALGMLVLPLGFLAIIGGIGMFFLVIFQAGLQLFDTYAITSGVPLLYTLSTFIPRFGPVEWFYAPVSLFALFAVVALIGSILFMIVGRRISHTPGSIGLGILAYMLVYGLIAPFWLMRAAADVATDTRRSWR